MGLYLDRPPHVVDPRGFSACNNVRIEQGRVHSNLMGWVQRGSFQLNGTVTLIDVFQQSTGPEVLIYGSPTDLYADNGANPVFITPTYTTGTVSVSGTAVTGTGTFWNTPIGGDFTATLAASAAVGATSIVLVSTPTGLTTGELVGAAPAIPVGTLVQAIVGTTIQLTQPLAFSMSQGNPVQFGGQLANFRKNVRPGDQISFAANVNSPSATWYTVQSVASNGSLTLTSAATTYSGAYTVRQLATPWDSPGAPFGAFRPVWNSETFPQAGAPFNKDMWFATNGQDPLISWDGASLAASYVTTVPFISTTIHRHKNLMVYGGLIGQGGQALGTSIANSDNGTPTNVATGVSFQGSVSDGPFQINHLATLGGTLMIYMSGFTGGSSRAVSTSGGSVVSASFVGFPTIWAFSEVIRSRGPLAGGLVAEFADRHQFVASDGQYRYNGLFIQVMNDQVWREVLKHFDHSRAGLAFSTINQTYGDLHWVVPLTTDPGVAPATAYTEAYMEQANSYLFKPFTQRDFPFTAAAVFPGVSGWAWNQVTTPLPAVPFDLATVPASQPAHLVGDINGRVWQLYSSNLQAGSPALSTCTWGARVMGDARPRCLVKRVYPMIEYIASPPSLVNVTLQLQDAWSAPILITDTQSFDPSYPGSLRFTTHYRRGRVATVTFSDAAGLGWICDGYDFDWVPGGLR